MMLELSRNGRHDEAWRLINLRTVPSWGYMVEMGATTIWERWDGYVKGRGFQDPGMNSFNHWAFGAVGEWVWRELAGINPDDAAARLQALHHPAASVRRSHLGQGRYDSIRGPIVSEWKLEDGQFTLRVEVPAKHDGHGLCAGERCRRRDRKRQTGRAGRGREVREDGRRQRGVRGRIRAVRVSSGSRAVRVRNHAGGITEPVFSHTVRTQEN